LRQPYSPLGRTQLRLFALSFLSLFLELTIIRWVPGSVRLVAYYSNLMLISSFLGLGLGAMLAEREKELIRWFPTLLAADVAFLAAARGALLPGSAVELRFFTAQSVGLVSYVVLLGIFVFNAAVFVPLGEQIGRQFQRLPRLNGYAWDLGGSLAGTVMFGAFAVLHFSPQVGIAIAIGLFALLYPPYALNSRTIVLSLLTLGASIATTEWRATWSAYNYLSMRAQAESTWSMLSEAPTPPLNLMTMKDPPAYQLSVNQNFYQYHRSINLDRFTPGTAAYASADSFRTRFEIPFAFKREPRQVAVVGAGGGMDVESALLHGAAHVDAVEIDPAIIGLARRYSAAGAYQNPAVTVHIDDARAFFERASPVYDLVVFGLLDSQGLFSSMANIRLDGFVYTVEGLRAAWKLLNDSGVLALSFGTTNRPWLGGKLYRMAVEATGHAPTVYAQLDKGNFVLILEKQPVAMPPEGFGTFVRWQPSPLDLTAPSATDDWPYLYLRKRTVPSDYLFVLSSLLLVSLVAVLHLKPRGAGLEELHFCALGAGFLLLETKSIVDCSLYFGATWLVALCVIAGVLLMVLLANGVAARIDHFNLWLYVPLCASVVLVYLVPRHAILAMPLLGRAAWTTLAVPLPIFFAGLIFSGSFRSASHPASAFGANLLGAVIGGFAEYLSMALGSTRLLAMVLAAYLVSLGACTVRRGRVPLRVDLP